MPRIFVLCGCCSFDLQELQRFPRLHAQLVEVVSELLRERLGPTTDYTQSLIDIQTAYINTNHPAFIQGSAAAAHSMTNPPKPSAPRVRLALSPSIPAAHTDHLSTRPSNISRRPSSPSTAPRPQRTTSLPTRLCSMAGRRPSLSGQGKVARPPHLSPCPRLRRRRTGTTRPRRTTTRRATSLGRPPRAAPGRPRTRARRRRRS